MRKSPSHLPIGHTTGGIALGSNHVGHSLGLAEVHFAVHKGSFGKLTRRGHASPSIYKALKYATLHQWRTVARYLHRVLARKGVRGTKKTHHNIVNWLATS